MPNLPRPAAQDLAVLSVLLLASVAAAALEGGVVRAYGGPALALAALVASGFVFTRGAAVPSRRVRLAAAIGAFVLAYQALPVPAALRALVAPGQAAWLARVGEPAPGAMDPWLARLAVFDVEAATGTAAGWTADVLAGAGARGLHTGALAPAEWAWTFGGLAACLLVFLAGRELGRSERAVVVAAVVMVAIGVIEVVFGLANRGGPSTGIGAKLHYIGSVTGTFVNRGHFAAFVCLSLGAAWGLAASQFPLLSEEVTRHMRHARRSSQPPSVLEAGGDRLPRLGLLAFVGALLVLGIVASQSRGPLVGIIVSALAVSVFAWRRKKENHHLSIGVGLLVSGGALALAALGARGAFGRFAGVLSGGDVSVTSRLTVWRESLEALRDAPLLGAGLGAWRLVQPLHEQGARLYAFSNAHSEPIEWIVEVGVVGVVALGLLLTDWGAACARGLTTTPHDPRSGIGVGLLIGVGAVALQSLGDFPLRTPGVALATALCAGLSFGALLPEEAAPRSRGWTAGLAILGLAGALLTTAAAVGDAGFEGTRAERVGEVPHVYYAARDLETVTEARAWSAVAAASAASNPLDPWAQLADARARSILATVVWPDRAGRGGDDAPEAHAFAADVALTRALVLRPADPRIAVHAARVLMRLSRASTTRDAYEERASALLVLAVGLDSWRAQEAFETAGAAPEASLARIAAAAAGDATARARVTYEYGRALERRGRTDAALAAHLEAAAIDPRYGPPAFAAGLIQHQRGVEADATRLLRSFLSSRERPGGMEGWAMLLLGDLDAADSRLRRVVAENPANRWAWEGLARVASERDDPRAELVAWRKIRDLAPNDAAIDARVRALETRGAER